jgi:hypothetical protein
MVLGLTEQNITYERSKHVTTDLGSRRVCWWEPACKGVAIEKSEPEARLANAV